MKKHLALGLLFILLLTTAGCGRSVNRVDFVVPAGTASQVIYSDVQVSPNKDHIKVSAGENLGDTAVHMKEAGTQQDVTGEGEYLTGGIEVKIPAEKDTWYQIGIVATNSTDKDITVSVMVADAQVRIP